MQTLYTNTAEDVHQAHKIAVSAMFSNKRAVQTHHNFFNSKQHKTRIARAKRVLTAYYSTPITYVNPRANKSKPFTALKIQSPVRPNTRFASVYKRFTKMQRILHKLNCQFVNAPNTNSVIVRVY